MRGPGLSGAGWPAHDRRVREGQERIQAVRDRRRPRVAGRRERRRAAAELLDRREARRSARRCGARARPEKLRHFRVSLLDDTKLKALELASGDVTERLDRLPKRLLGFSWKF